MKNETLIFGETNAANINMLSTVLLEIVWNVDPEIFNFSLFGREISIRWYGLLFATGFIVGQYILGRIFKIEGKTERDLEILSFYVVIATVIGARLGHCLFYDPEYYLSNPIEILKVWEGGLASHGATIGILTALYLYARKRPDQSFLWVVDRIVIVVALGGMLIRLGNLMNSEIIGSPTEAPWAFVFLRANIADPTTPRHPSQLYEAAFCLFLFVLLLRIYSQHKKKTPEGLLFGLFMVLLFTFRFFVEFLKENQVAFEAGLVLNMGQILSIPAVLAGLYILYLAKKNTEKRQLNA
ncbi:MAG: prolipoprotein diacylglyceryl transferase [Bacteroidota bacterium]